MKRIACLLIAAVLLLVGLSACNKKINIRIIVDGNEAETVELQKGSKLTDLVPPEKAGHEFIGWFTDSGFISKFDENDTIGKNITLYAKYKKNTYTLTFKAQGAADITRIAEYGSTLTDIPAVPEKIGHTGAWESNDFNNIVSNKTINAVYTPFQMTLTFKADGASDTIRTVPYGGTLTDIPAVPGKTGKRGVWSVTDFSNIVENKTINGVYEDIWLTVTFVSALGEEYFEETTEIIYGGSLSVIPQPKSYEGHTGIWNNTVYTDIISDITINAIYTPMQYSVRFIDVSGNIFHTLEIPYGTKISDALDAISDENIKASIRNVSNDDLPVESQSPRNINFRYGERFGNADINSVVRKDYDFHLIYDIKIYVTFHLQGGEFDEITDYVDETPIEMLAGDSISEPVIKKRYGYRFEGWFSEANDGNKVYFDTALPTEDFHAYAVWTELFCDVSFPEIEGVTFVYEVSPDHLRYGSDFTFSVTADTIEILEIMANMLLLLMEQDGFYTLTEIEDDINIAVKTASLDIFTLRFFAQNSEVPVYMRSVTAGQPLGKEPPLPQILGSIGYWYNDDAQFDFSEAIFSDMDFTARYFASNYGINYHIDNVIFIGSVEYQNTDFEFLSPPKKQGKLFDGWFYDKTYTQRATKEYIAELGTSVNLYPKWIDELSINHPILGKWAGDITYMEFSENGNVRINDGNYFLECGFSVSETGVFILGQKLEYDGETLIFRGKTLTKTEKSYLFADFVSYAVIMFEDGIVGDAPENSNRYWYYDEETRIPFEFGKAPKPEYIENNIIKLYGSDYRFVMLHLDASGGVTIGNITDQEVAVKKNENMFPSSIVSAEKPDHEFLGWALEGTQTLVDIHYLNTFEVYSLNLYAVYAPVGAYSGETISGLYSAERGDEILLIEFMGDGSYQITFYDLENLTTRRNIIQFYSHSENGFVDAYGRAITLSEDGITMMLPEETQSITLTAHTLSYESSRYVNSEDDRVLLFSSTGMILEQREYSPVIRKGQYYYYFAINNSIEILTILDISEWEAAELIFPTEYRGVYEGYYLYKNNELLLFNLEINDSSAVWIFFDENEQPVDEYTGILDYIEEDKYYVMEALGHKLYMDENTDYFLAPLEYGDTIQITKLP